MPRSRRILSACSIKRGSAAAWVECPSAHCSADTLDAALNHHIPKAKNAAGQCSLTVAVTHMSTCFLPYKQNSAYLVRGYFLSALGRCGNC